MKRKRKSTKYEKERAILSDVLPYELPLIFSNRYFCEFLLDNGIECREGEIVWRQADPALDSVIRLLFGIDRKTLIETKERIILGRQVLENHGGRFATPLRAG